MRTSILAFAAVLMIAGCGDNGTVKLDGSTNNKPDLKMTTNAPDLAMPKATNCFSIFSCEFIDGKPDATCRAGTPQASKDAFDAVLNCQAQTCGFGVDAGTNSPCATASMTTDAGADACNNCLLNTIVGPDSIFGDGMGNAQMCVPTTATECGACKDQIIACAEQCVTDADCAGFTMPLTCQGGQCM